MGQAVSSGNFPLFSLSSNTLPDFNLNRREDSHESFQKTNSSHSRNLNSLSCFKSQQSDIENRNHDCHESSRFIVGRQRSTRHNSLTDLSDTMHPRKFYNVSNKTDNNEEGKPQSMDTSNSNYSCVKRYDFSCFPLRSNSNNNEINGNHAESTQSCSYDNSNKPNCSTNTSVDRYMNAVFNQSLKNLSLEDGPCEDGQDCKKYLKSKSLKRTYKQLKGKGPKECAGCSKEPKIHNKLGTKKKHTWSMKFCGSKLGKMNNGKGLENSASSSTSDSESGCICTSYKKVDYNEKQENASIELPKLQHNLTLGWASERINMNRKNSSNSTNQSNSNNYNQQNNVATECTSCENCRVDLNSLTGLSNIRRLPINITVTTRVGPNLNYNAGNTSNENNVIFLSLTTQNPQVIDLSRFNPDDHPLEDCDERARALRAREIAEGVEPPPGYNSPHIQVVSHRELRALLFQQQLPPPTSSLNVQPLHQNARIHTQVDYIHCLVPDLQSITSCSFYWGKMDRYEAERLLDGKDEGTFLLRDSAQEEHLFSVSFRKYQRSLHARIEQFNHKFSFDSHDPGVFTSDTVTGLIEHYKDPSCVMFFEPMLTAPLSRTFTFPLQHLCRAVIVSCTTYDGINQLRLPPSIKAYLKEYHYRQRVRVKRFDESNEMPQET